MTGFAYEFIVTGVVTLRANMRAMNMFRGIENHGFSDMSFAL